MQPSVTALCLTKNRREWLPLAIKYFQAQSYPNRKMLILADGEADGADIVPDDPRISFVIAPPQPYWNIGKKRNHGCSLIDTELIAHFDDDDFSAPGRLTDQVSRLMETGVSVTGYRSMRFTDGERCWRYEGTPMFALGTSLLYRREYWEKHQFPSRDVGEDNEFGAMAAAERVMSVADAGELMSASIHRGNISPRDMSGHSWILLCGRGKCVHAECFL